MKTNKKQRERENKILAENALKAYQKSLLSGDTLIMDGVLFIYDTNLEAVHLKCVLERYFKNDTVIRLKEIVNNN